MGHKESGAHILGSGERIVLLRNPVRVVKEYAPIHPLILRLIKLLNTVRTNQIERPVRIAIEYPHTMQGYMNAAFVQTALDENANGWHTIYAAEYSTNLLYQDVTAMYTGPRAIAEIHVGTTPIIMRALKDGAKIEAMEMEDGK